VKNSWPDKNKQQNIHKTYGVVGEPSSPKVKQISVPFSPYITMEKKVAADGTGPFTNSIQRATEIGMIVTANATGYL
jgi:hypothetical protein